MNGSVVLGLMPAQPQPRAAWLSPLPASAKSPADARQLTQLFLSKCRKVPADLGETAALLVSELVTNAYKAMLIERFTEAGHIELPIAERIELSLRLFDDYLLIEVIDCSPNVPVPRLAPSPDAEGWRGLAVVEGLSREWGYFWRDGRKVVFCTVQSGICDEIDVPNEGRREIG